VEGIKPLSSRFYNPIIEYVFSVVPRKGNHSEETIQEMKKPPPNQGCLTPGSVVDIDHFRLCRFPKT